METVAQRLGLRQRPAAAAAATAAATAAAAPRDTRVVGTAAATAALNDATCRICLDGPGRHGFIAPCLCSGSMRWVHRSCLLRWQIVTARDSNNDYTRCETCKGRYNIPGPPVDLRVRLRRAAASAGWTALTFCRLIGRWHIPLVALMAASTALSIATAELMEGAPSVGWWLGGAPWRILAMAMSLAVVSLGTAIVFTSLDGAVLNDRVQRRLLRNVFIQNTLVVLSLVLYVARNTALAGWLAGAWLLETVQGVHTTLAFRQEFAAWLIALLRSWNLIGPVLPFFLFVAHELRRSVLPGERRGGVIARQGRAILLSLLLVLLSIYCLVPLLDISAATAVNTPGGAVEILFDRLDQLGLLDKSNPYHQKPRFNHQGPVWTWPPDPLVNASADTLNFAATTGGYRRRGHSPEALDAALDHLYRHERQRRRAAASVLDLWHNRFPPASPQLYAPPPGEPWTWTMLPQNCTDYMAVDVDVQVYSAFPLSRAWRPQQSFLVEEPVERDYVEPEQPSQEQHSPPASFLVSGSGCNSCNGKYVLDGEHDGVPQYSYGEGENKIMLLRYAMPTGARYWYLSIASDLHSGKGDIYRAKSPCKRRSCVDLPPDAGWRDTCTLQGQKCTEKWLKFHRWRVGGPPFPTVQALGQEGSRHVNQSALGTQEAAPFELTVHVFARNGDTVLVSPGVHSAGVSLTKHLTIRGACGGSASNEKSCESGHPPAVLVGSGCNGAAGMLRWWIRRTIFPSLLTIGEELGALQRSSGYLGYSAQECAAVWVTSPAAILADLTIASTAAAWEATAWAGDQDTGHTNPTEPINLARPTTGPFQPVALEISAGSSAVVAHCVIVGGVVVRGPRTSPFLDFLTIMHATTGLLISDHASPRITDVRLKYVETGVEVTRWAMPTLSRLHVVSARQTGVHFSTESSGTLTMSAVVGSGTCNLAVTSGASPDVSDSLFRLSAQSGVLFAEGGKGTMRRCHIVESNYAGLEIRGTETDPDIYHSSVHRGAAVGLYVHSGGVGSLTDVTLLDNRNGACEISEGGRSRLSRCHLGGHSVQTAVVLDIHGVHSTPELAECVVDATAVEESVAVKVSDAAGPVLHHVEVRGADVGVLALGSVAPRLVGCNVHDNRVGVELVGEGGSTILDGSSVYDNQRSIVGSDGGYARVHKCNLRAPGVAGLGTDFSGGASITVQ